MLRLNSTNDLSSLVKSSRKEQSMTQAQLAAKAGVKPLWISQFENGKSTVQLNLVLRVLKVLGLSIAVHHTNPPTPKSSPDSRVNLDQLLADMQND